MNLKDLTCNKLTLVDADELYYIHRGAYEGLKEEVNRLNEELIRMQESIVVYENARAHYAAMNLNIELSKAAALKAEEAVIKSASVFFSKPSGRSFNSK